MQNFSFYRLFRLLIRNIIVILITAVVFAAATFSYCKFWTTPKYTASGSLLVSNGAIINSYQVYENDKLNNADIIASLNIITTVIDVLKTNGIYKQLSAELDGKYSYSQLSARSTISHRDANSLFIDFRFTSSNPEEAIKITNKFLELAPDYINQYVPDSGSRIITTAERASKTYPNTVKFTAFAFLCGAIFAYAIVFVMSFFTTVVQNDTDFKDHFNIPVIGNIPSFSDSKSNKKHKRYYKDAYTKYYGGY